MCTNLGGQIAAGARPWQYRMHAPMTAMAGGVERLRISLALGDIARDRPASSG